MKIGEFAKAVVTRISVLRHYDREGLLRPVFTDKFTGWEKHFSNLTIADYRKKMVKHFYTLIYNITHSTKVKCNALVLCVI